MQYVLHSYDCYSNSRGSAAEFKLVFTTRLASQFWVIKDFPNFQALGVTLLLQKTVWLHLVAAKCSAMTFGRKCCWRSRSVHAKLQLASPLSFFCNHSLLVY